jgi:hypothetical protein
LIAGLLLLKQLEDLIVERVVVQWKRNPYYHAFYGICEYHGKLLYQSAKLVHSRKHFGKASIAGILIWELRRGFAATLSV